MTHTNRAALAALINSLEFGSTFHVDEAGTYGSTTYAPDVYHDDDADITVDGVPLADSEWSAMIGMTGQYGYSGAVMHPSEYIGESVATELLRLSDDGANVFALVTVECEPTDDDPEPEPAGWAILYRPAAS